MRDLLAQGICNWMAASHWSLDVLYALLLLLLIKLVGDEELTTNYNKQHQDREFKFGHMDGQSCYHKQDKGTLGGLTVDWVLWQVHAADGQSC